MIVSVTPSMRPSVCIKKSKLDFVRSKLSYVNQRYVQLNFAHPLGGIVKVGKATMCRFKPSNLNSEKLK